MAKGSCSLIITRFKAKLVTSSDPLSREMTEMTTLISIILGINKFASRQVRARKTKGIVGQGGVDVTYIPRKLTTLGELHPLVFLVPQSQSSEQNQEKK